MKVKLNFNKMFIVMNNKILIQITLKENQIKYWQNIHNKNFRIIVAIIIKSQHQLNIELKHYSIQDKMKFLIKIKLYHNKVIMVPKDLINIKLKFLINMNKVRN